MFSKKAIKNDKIFIVDLTLGNKCQIDGEDFINFCVLLGKHELYLTWKLHNLTIGSGNSDGYAGGRGGTIKENGIHQFPVILKIFLSMWSLIAVVFLICWCICCCYIMTISWLKWVHILNGAHSDRKGHMHCKNDFQRPL